MKLDVVDIKGKKTGTMTGSDLIWKVPMNKVLVAQAVHVYSLNRRQGPAKVKSRGEVLGSRRKVWKQKGTGRARHGDRFAPIFVGGGVAHGPTGRENYRKSMNKKMRQKALFMVLSDKLDNKHLTVIDELPKGLTKTRQLQEIMGKIATEKKVLLVTAVPERLLTLAIRNLREVNLSLAHQLNALVVLEHQRLVITKEAVKKFESHFLGAK